MAEAFPWAAAMSLTTSIISANYSRQVGKYNYRMQVSDHQLAAAQFGYQNRIGEAQHNVAIAQAEAQNAITDAQNQMARTEAGLANFMTAENNRRRLEGIGAAVEAATIEGIDTALGAVVQNRSRALGALPG